MVLHTPSSAAQALYRIFVTPNIPTTALRPCGRLQPLCVARYIAGGRPHIKVAPVVRKERWNNEIRSHTIQLVDPVTAKLQPPVSTHEILEQIDLTTERLVQLSPVSATDQRHQVPVCKIVNIKEAQRAEMIRNKKAKEQRRIRVIESTVKKVELNWAIDGHDLERQLSRVSEWLAAGRRVEVVLAPKKAKRRATPAECHALIKQVTGSVNKIEGARLIKPMEGKIGQVAVFQIQGRLTTIQPPAAQTDGGVDEQETAPIAAASAV